MALTLDELIRVVVARSDDPLAVLEEASWIAAELAATGEALLTHFVVESRAADNTWAEIGKALGVSRQAVHQRFIVSIGEDGLRSNMTPDAAAVLDAARIVATEMNHTYIGTEHLLLALFDSKEAAALAGRGLTRDGIEAQVIALAPRGPSTVSGSQPITPRARKALEEAIDAAKEQGAGLAGTEHLLLGLYRGQDGLARRLLLGEEPHERDPNAFVDD